MSGPNAQNPVKAKAIARPAPMHRLALPLMALLLAMLALFSTARAQDTTIAHAISKFGDIRYPADFENFDYVNPDAPKGGTFSTWAYGSFDTLNPYSVNGVAASGANIMIERLMTGTQDEPDTVYGLLAETVEYPADHSWAIFTLREGIRFSDGTPVTAADVVFSHNLFVTQGIPDFAAAVKAGIPNVEALDDRRVKFYFAEPSETTDWIQQAAATPVLKASQFEDRELTDTTLEPYIGTGAYMFDDMDTGRWIQYRRNPNYWGADLPINAGQNNFDVIRYQYYSDPTAAFEGFKAGEYLFRSENSSAAWANDYDFPALTNGWVIKTELPDGDIGQAQGFAFNLYRPQFADPRVRQAIGMAFNFEWSNRTLFYGLYKRVDSFWENSVLEAQGDIPDDERAILEPLAADLPPEVFSEPAYSPPVSSDNQADRAVLRAAGRLLDEAGWTVGSDGKRRNADGVVLEAEFLNYSPLFDRIINPYIENLERLGVVATMRRVDTAQFVERSRNRDFDIVIDTFANSLTPGLGTAQTYHSDNATGETRNTTGLANPAIDALVEMLPNAKTRDELNLITRALDRALRAMHIWVPQWYKDVHTVAYWDTFGMPDQALSPYALNPAGTWWWDAEKAAALQAAGAL